MKICFRADASARIGTGHIMRCLALALTAKKLGHDIVMLCHVEVEWVLDKLRREKLPFYQLPGPVPASEDAHSLSSVIQKHNPDIAILDGYHFGTACHKAIQAAGIRLLVIDDYNHLPEYHADILLNQNLGANTFNYKGVIGKKLLGPQYALLRPEFIQARQLAEQRSCLKTPMHLLLTLGGGDFSDYLSLLAPLLMSSELAGKTLNVIAGKMSCNTIQTILIDSPAKLKILSNVDDMPSLLLHSDLAISAGGSTCWELCCLGVPFVTVELAENQHTVIDQLDKQGIASPLTRESLHLLLCSSDVRNSKCKLGFELITPLGASNVLSCILNIL